MPEPIIIKKKYTIIFSEFVTRGNMRSSIVKFARVETDNLPELMKAEEYSNTNFVFVGWPDLEEVK
jgi:hypothetical protein